MSQHRIHRLGDLQLRIMQSLWQRGEATVAQVLEDSSGHADLAYTTIATMLRKMEVRGLVAHRAEGRSFLYAAKVAAQDVSRGMADHLVDRLFEGSLLDVVQHLLTTREVSREELRELEKLIAGAEEKAMSSALYAEAWWPSFGLPAVEAAALVGLAALVARFVAPASWRRTVWQGCFVGLFGLLVLEFSGVTRHLQTFVMAKAPAPLPSLAPAHGPPGSPPGVGVHQPMDAVRPLGAAERGGERPQSRTLSRPVEPQPVSAPSPRPSRSDSASIATTLRVDPRPMAVFTPEQLVAWLVVLWLGGALVFLALNALARFSFAFQRGQGRTVADPALLHRVGAMAARLGLRRSVRLCESSRWTSPVAAGVFRPAIGLPEDFTTDHSPEQQDVMLAHELAHLAARDPFWYLLADALAALLWWHPLAWWARRRLHAASESAADEASLLLHDGPRVLAECLVALGGRMARRQPAGGISVEGAGFRSGLGRRVD